MDSQGYSCPNLDCPARGQRDQGTIRAHSQKDHRYRCTICHRTFAVTKGCPFYRLHAQREVFVSVVTLLAFGCPPWLSSPPSVWMSGPCGPGKQQQAATANRCISISCCSHMTWQSKLTNSA